MSIERIARSCICCDSNDLRKASAVLMPFVAKRVFDHEPVMISPEWGMRDLQPGMAYSVCSSMQCSQCGVLFLDFRFSETEMASLYKGYRNEEYVNLREHYEPGYRNRNKLLFSSRHAHISELDKFIMPWMPPSPSVLDWGGDTGINTPLLDHARLVHIYDISGKPVIEGIQSVDLTTVKQTKYDIIICSNVLEHVPFPQDFICEIVSVMDSETLLFLEVPYEELMRSHPSSKELYTSKHHWHEHINFFSEESLLALIAGAGLKLVEIKTVMISIEGCNSFIFAVLCRLN